MLSILVAFSVWLSGLPQLLDYNIPNPNSVRVSWYEYGHTTANGESYYPDSLTCASPNLPFNTILHLQVEDREVVVRVNDRGPFATCQEGKAIFPLRPHPTRKLDLSRGAFVALFGDKSIGVSEVKVVRVEWVN